MQKRLRLRITECIINQSGFYDGMMGPIATSLDTFRGRRVYFK